MKYNELIDLLLSCDVYNRLKENEAEVFALIPELRKCKGFDQKNSWHVYDVYEHILHVVAGVDATLPLRITALFHDTGKPSAFTLDDNGVGHFYGHWDYSVEIFKEHSPALGLSGKDTDLITDLIFYHDVNLDKMDEAQISEMINKIGYENIPLLFKIKQADLLAQSEVYHYNLSKINEQEKRLLDSYRI